VTAAPPTFVSRRRCRLLIATLKVRQPSGIFIVFFRILLLLGLIAIFSQNRMMSWPGGAHKKKLTPVCQCLPE